MGNAETALGRAARYLDEVLLAGCSAAARLGGQLCGCNALAHEILTAHTALYTLRSGKRKSSSKARQISAACCSAQHWLQSSTPLRQLCITHPVTGVTASCALCRSAATRQKPRLLLSLCIVRNPYERMLSFYLDKIKDTCNRYPNRPTKICPSKVYWPNGLPQQCEQKMCVAPISAGSKSSW